MEKAHSDAFGAGGRAFDRPARPRPKQILAHHGIRKLHTVVSCDLHGCPWDSPLNVPRGFVTRLSAEFESIVGPKKSGPQKTLLRNVEKKSWKTVFLESQTFAANVLSRLVSWRSRVRPGIGAILRVCVLRRFR
jgi:hypothetical protein